MLDPQLAPVAAELDVWRDSGLCLPIWWRDDDAIAPSPALDRLLLMAAGFEAPLHLAVIPHLAEGDLARRLQDAEKVFAMPHGWQHENHAPPTEKSAEFGAHRSLIHSLDEAKRGWHRIETLFGPHALPVFVPPWNRVCPAVVDRLADCGLIAISTFLPRQQKFPAPNLLRVNTHLDPIFWRGGRGLVEPELLAVTVVADLRDRRHGRADNSEPYGFLTHHLVHNEATWVFVARLIEVFLRSDVARWTSPIAEL